jgi:hypothetical protein
MASFYASHQTPAGTNLSIITLASAAAGRGALHQIIIGSDATPADIATEFALLRFTAAPVGGTVLTANKADPVSNATGSGIVTGGTMTEPTYDAVATLGLLQIALNQRATFTWIANPGREIKGAVGTANGVGLRSIASGGTPNINATVAWDE